MALNTVPFPTDSAGVPYYSNADASGYLTMPVEQYIRSGSNLFVPVSTTNPAPTSVNKMVKGSVTTAINAATTTTTSSEIDCTGFNAVLVEITMSAAYNWTIKVQGCLTTGGTFRDWYDEDNAIMDVQTSTSKGIIFRGIPDFTKIVATEDADGATCTVKVQPLNL